MDDVRYPIGEFQAAPNPGLEDRERWIAGVAQTPAKLREAVHGLSTAGWETPYREGGWTARQVVHHVADSHMQSYGRFKLALTEEDPLIKTYAQDRWAELADTPGTPPMTSLALLEALHERWTVLLRSLTNAEWLRTFRHPELGSVNLTKAVQLYDWHGRHHTAHIAGLRRRKGL